MGKFAKWIGGGLGFVFGGPIGGLLGFFLGSVVDGTSVRWEQTGGDRRVYRTTPGDFGMSLIVLIAAVMKADGKVLRSELDYVKRFFVTQFGPETAQEALQMLRDLLRQNIPLRDVCTQIRQNMDYPSRLQLIHILWNISAADNRFETAETNVIKTIADYLGITQGDYDSIRKHCISHKIEIVNIYTEDVNYPQNLIRSRVFAPGFGYLEDPATGSANSALAYFLKKENVWNGNPFSIEQGVLKADPSLIRIIFKNNRVLFGGKAKTRIDGYYFLV